MAYFKEIDAARKLLELDEYATLEEIRESKKGNLLLELETPATREQILSLYPREMVQKEIREKLRFYSVVTLIILALLVASSPQFEIIVLAFFVIIAPVILIGLLDTMDYVRLLSRVALDRM